ncbi:hypothetical protein MJG53_014543 [Ovis ammon polii x Ovis aries]|uniref:Uncharacterized protein n=1 Tax=Ovis ammon polii x Ovis aries TaxID=2918886 RepID=A0ACB9UH92_9CETA|nr:hypothetical protein MJG53_014543 [Ovis ammon polii x Ovis aries]
MIQSTLPIVQERTERHCSSEVGEGQDPNRTSTIFLLSERARWPGENFPGDPAVLAPAQWSRDPKGQAGASPTEKPAPLGEPRDSEDLKGSEMYQVGIEQHLVEKGGKCYKVSQGYLEKEVLKAGREARKDPTPTPPQDLLEDLPSDRAEEEAPSRAKENPKPEKSMEVAISVCEHNSRDKSMAVINTYSWWMA